MPQQDFEKPFLETSKQFYKIESESFLQENSCSDYLKKVEDRLLEEQDRVNSCLSMDYNAGDHGSGEQGGIKQVIEHELIGRHMQVCTPPPFSLAILPSRAVSPPPPTPPSRGSLSGI